MSDAKDPGQSSSAAASEAAYEQARNAFVRDVDDSTEGPDGDSPSPVDNDNKEPPLDETVSASDAATLKEEGNAAFKSNENDRALEKYTAALKSAHLSDNDRGVIFGNRAAVHLRKEAWKEVLNDTKQSLKYKPGYEKALIRRKKAAEKLEDWNVAVQTAKDLNAPQAEIAALETKAKQKLEKDTAEMMDQLKGVGNSILSNFGLSLDNFKMEKDPTTGSYSVQMKQ